MTARAVLRRSHYPRAVSGADQVTDRSHAINAVDDWGYGPLLRLAESFQLAAGRNGWQR
jgi:hypothetical protein